MKLLGNIDTGGAFGIFGIVGNLFLLQILTVCCSFSGQYGAKDKVEEEIARSPRTCRRRFGDQISKAS